jgi:hypothetical protein
MKLPRVHVYYGDSVPPRPPRAPRAPRRRPDGRLRRLPNRGGVAAWWRAFNRLWQYVGVRIGCEWLQRDLADAVFRVLTSAEKVPYNDGPWFLDPGVGVPWADISRPGVVRIGKVNF